MNTDDIVIIGLSLTAAAAMAIVICVAYKIRQLLKWRDTVEAQIFLETKTLPDKHAFGTLKHAILRRLITARVGMPNVADPSKDPQKLNKDHSCCICLEDYVDEEGNPIIQESENLASEPMYDVIGSSMSRYDVIHTNVTPYDAMPSNFEILRDLAAKNRKMAMDNASYLAMMYHINMQNSIQSGQNNVDKDGGLILGLLKCGHVFHFECIWKWMQSRTKCPVCRSYTLMNQDDIQAVSLLAVFPDLKPKNKSKDTENEKELVHCPKQLDIPEVHHSVTANKQMCVFSVQKELEARKFSSSETTESEQKRLVFGEVGQFKAKNNGHTQGRSEVNTCRPQHLKGQAVF